MLTASGRATIKSIGIGENSLQLNGKCQTLSKLCPDAVQTLCRSRTDPIRTPDASHSLAIHYCGHCVSKFVDLVWPVRVHLTHTGRLPARRWSGLLANCKLNFYTNQDLRRNGLPVVHSQVMDCSPRRARSVDCSAPDAIRWAMHTLQIFTMWSLGFTEVHRVKFILWGL